MERLPSTIENNRNDSVQPDDQKVAHPVLLAALKATVQARESALQLTTDQSSRLPGR